jgi:hypothetical protein
VVEFLCSFQEKEFSGRIKSSTYLVGPPSALFDAMAEKWQGWNDEISWADMEKGLCFTATSDSTGHVTLMVSMRSYFPDRQLKATVMLEAGGLERIANQIGRLFHSSHGTR